MSPFRLHRLGAVRSLLLMATSGMVACGQVPEGNPPEAPETVAMSGFGFELRLTGVGFATPESALHDPEEDVYLISNIVGGAEEEDGNGFISRVSPAGEVLDLTWIDGSRPGVTLNAPKGMAIVADTLFVTDIRCIRGFNRITGDPQRELCLDEATFLNDLTATPRGDLFFSDSGTDQNPGAVYFLRGTADVPQKVVLADGAVLSGESLGGPNGLYADRRGLLVATFDSGELFRVTQGGERIQLLPPSEMGLDGVISLGERGFLLSSWGDSTVYHLGPDGALAPLVRPLDSPADIGFDALRNRVLIPLFRANELLILEIR